MPINKNLTFSLSQDIIVSFVAHVNFVFSDCLFLEIFKKLSASCCMSCSCRIYSPQVCSRFCVVICSPQVCSRIYCNLFLFLVAGPFYSSSNTSNTGEMSWKYLCHYVSKKLLYDPMI